MGFGYHQVVKTPLELVYLALLDGVFYVLLNVFLFLLASFLAWGVTTLRSSLPMTDLVVTSTRVDL